jgi:hypothetical protein
LLDRSNPLIRFSKFTWGFKSYLTLFATNAAVLEKTKQYIRIEIESDLSETSTTVKTDYIAYWTCV